MIIKLNQHPSIAAWTKIEQYHLHRGDGSTLRLLHSFKYLITLLIPVEKMLIAAHKQWCCMFSLSIHAHDREFDLKILLQIYRQYSVSKCMFPYGLVCVFMQVTQSSRCTFSHPTFLPPVLVDAMILRCVCVMENMWRITIHHSCMTFIVTPRSPARWTLIPSHDMLKSLNRLPKLWRNIKVRSQANRRLMTLMHTLAQIHKAFKTRWLGRRFCGDPGFSRAVGPFLSATAKKIWCMFKTAVFHF